MASGAMAHFGFIKEATKGTPLTVTKFFDATSVELDDAYPREAIPTIRGDRSRVRSIQKLVESKGSWSSPLYFDVLPWFLMFGLGPDTCTAAGTAWSHVFKGTTASLPSFTAEVKYASGIAKQMTYCMVDKLSFSMKAGEVAEASCEWIGTSVTTSAPATPTLPTGDYVASFQHAVVEFADTATTKVISAEVAIENNLEAVATLNGTFYPQRVEEGFRSITCDMEMDFLDLTEYNLSKAGTQTKVEFILTHSYAIGGGVNYYKYHFTLPNCKFANVAAPVEAEGIISQKLETIVLYDATATYDLNVNVVNADTAYS